MDFVLPCSIKTISIPEFQIGKMHYNSSTFIDFDVPGHKTAFSKNNRIGDTIFKVSTKSTSHSNKTYEIKSQNYYDDEVRITIDVTLNPIDDTVGFTFLRNLSSFTGGNK